MTDPFTRNEDLIAVVDEEQKRIEIWELTPGVNGGVTTHWEGTHADVVKMANDLREIRAALKDFDEEFTVASDNYTVVHSYYHPVIKFLEKMAGLLG